MDNRADRSMASDGGEQRQVVSADCGVQIAFRHKSSGRSLRRLRLCRRRPCASNFRSLQIRTGARCFQDHRALTGWCSPVDKMVNGDDETAWTSCVEAVLCPSNYARLLFHAVM